MATNSMRNSEMSHPVKRADIYREFVLWTAMPPLEKRNLGIETQTAFCEYYKIGINTPTAWKHRADFEGRVDAILKMWSTDKTPDVIHGIYRSAVKGNPMSQLLWLQYFKKFSPRTEVEHTNKVEVGVNDIRHLIELLPEPLKSKHYANLRELLDDSSAVRDARVVEDSHWTTRPADPILGEADNDAQDVPEQEGHAVAPSHQTGVRAPMDWGNYPSDHQGTARGW